LRHFQVISPPIKWEAEAEKLKRLVAGEKID
jgi:hypothetical protein